MNLSLNTFTRLSLLVLSVTTFAACSKKESADKVPVQPASVELISGEASNGDSSTSIYSFFAGLRKDQIDDGYEPGELWYQADQFQSTTVTDQVGIIRDLGEKNCADVENTYERKTRYKGRGKDGYPHPEDRKADPMFWLEYSKPWQDIQREKDLSGNAPVNVGHCYLIIHADNREKIIAMFHVQSQVKGRSVVIDQLEVFQRAKVTDPNVH